MNYVVDDLVKMVKDNDGWTNLSFELIWEMRVHVIMPLKIKECWN